MGNNQFKFFLEVVFPDGKQGEVASAPSPRTPQPRQSSRLYRLLAWSGGAVGLLAAAGLGPVPFVHALLQRIRTSPGTAWAVVLGWCSVQEQEWARLNHLLNTSSP